MPNLTVIIQNERLARIDGRWSAEERTTVNSVPDRFRWGQRGSFLFDPTPANIEYIKTNLADATWTDKKEVVSEVSQPVHRAPDYTFIPKTAMMNHQEKAFDWARTLDQFAIFLDKGLGKTKLILDIIADRYERHEIDGALVIAPSGVHRQWIEEQVPLHWVDRVPLLSRVHSSFKPITEKDPIQQKSTYCRILAINVEALSRGQGIEIAQQFVASGRMAVIVDESTRIRSPTAACTKNVLALSDKAPVRIISSGDPSPHGAENLYTQFRFLDRRILGHGSYTSFQQHYCVLKPIYGGPRGAMAVVGYRNMAELAARIRPFSITARKEECVDLPPKLYERVYVEYTAEQRRLYNQVRREFLAEINDETLLLPNALARLVRLQQILSGFLPSVDDTDTVLHYLDSNRITVLEEQVKQITGKMIIWARFQEDLNQICTMLSGIGESFVRYDGTTIQKDRGDVVSSFTTGETRIFVSNPAAGGIGLNLQIASTAIYYNNSFNFEHREQSEDRCHRIGTVAPVTYIDLVVPKSIDTVILSVLADRADLARMLLSKGPTLLKELE
jgi:SNF2 family DNA or RNA helicase